MNGFKFRSKYAYLHMFNLLLNVTSRSNMSSDNLILGHMGMFVNQNHTKNINLVV